MVRNLLIVTTLLVLGFCHPVNAGHGNHTIKSMVQWIGWLLSVIACFMWVWFGYRDKDYPRALMELMYLILSMRAMYNWLI